MKNIFCISLILASVFIFSGCQEVTTLDTSKITYFIELQLKGNATVFVPLNSNFIDEGVTAIQDGEDASSLVKTNGDVDTSSPGIYSIQYVATNADGFSSSVSRTVIVYDDTPSDLESALYTVSPKSNRNGVTFYGKEFTIFMYQEVPGIFYFSDLFGGYYDQRAGYGPDYAMLGYVQLESDNTLTLLDSYVYGWGDSLDGLTNGIYDPATKTISWTAKYVGTYNFNVIATKQ